MLRTTRLPSSGGMGSRLKKNSDRLMRMARLQEQSHRLRVRLPRD